MKARDAIAGYLSQPRLPSRSIGVLPPSGVTLNAHGKQQLRSAIILAALLSTELVILKKETHDVLQRWLADCMSDKADEARLLHSVVLIFQRAETEEEFVKGIPAGLMETLSSWLDEYLKRREHDQ